MSYIHNSLADDIKHKVSIPKYFREIIVPEIPDYYSMYGADFEYRPVTLCPLHDEDTPSFRFYEETNTFYCFGCRAGGDVITLHRKFVEARNGESVSFKDAIHFLNNFFLKGLELTDIITSTKKEDKVSSIAEALVYSDYIRRLELMLIRDEKIDLHKKMEIYETIDVINVLTSCNEVNALDGVRYVKMKVREIVRG